MPKGKKCSQKGCNGRMRRCYTRSYWTGSKCTTEPPFEFIDIPKGRYEPQGWLCDKCGMFIPDENNYWMNKGWEKRKNKQQKSRRELRYKLKSIRAELMEYKESAKRHCDFIENYTKSLYTRRCWNIKSAYGVRQFLKGLKQGWRDSKKSHKEEIERMKLTDDEILKKAKLIESGRRIRGEI